MPALRRNEIGWNERFRRCLYFFLRDELDSVLVTESLIASYKNFKDKKKDYPFVEMRELKPRAKLHGPEFPDHRHFIVIFNEDILPSDAKVHIRFFDSNKITKENLVLLSVFDLQDVFHQRMRYFEDTEFVSLLKRLVKADYALLIQRDPSVKARYRFGLTHFHVRIDWPIAVAAEDLGRYLRYISKDLYEKGERVGETLQQKLYEYYGFHHTVGGRRTAALVAARYLSRYDFISTVYISSSEARTLIRTSEQGISKYVLIRVPNSDIAELAKTVKMKESDFASAYLIDRTPEYGVGIFLVTYSHNEHSNPPPDGKVRELNPDYQWLNVGLQLLVPPPTSGDARPIQYSRVYS
ncbi:MAG: hypothetical protein HY912_23045 [Desulfomonile tiedjei]|uniref:Uncharacterized protein n=1 Tax=Desulfomonile tiedjei TaxID=2358 RepID=A0A9D6VBH2_9BACT|nr:hypothetical protein [Desulfomonile tiedjei]